jgi:hypothetical protein
MQKREKTKKIKKKENKKKKNENNKCFIYKSCDHVPCGHVMNKCTPSYCVPGSSRNWGYCNMANWGSGYEKYKSTCRDERKCKLMKTKKTKNTVDALTLHNKMPYIWRFLKPTTRKYMIELANMKVKKINIPGHIFPDLNKKKGENVKKIFKNMTKKNRAKFRKLRKKYKNI